MILELENWLPVAGYEDHYEVSSFGRVRSKGRLIKNSRGITRIYGGVIIRPKPGHAGHQYVSLSRDNEVHTALVHVLVCEAFHGPKPADKDLVAHFDGEPTNNRPDNLRWATYIENEADKRRHQRNAWGRRNPRSRIGPEVIEEIQAKAVWARGEKAEMADRLGISRTQLCDIANGHSWNPDGNRLRRQRRLLGRTTPTCAMACERAFGRVVPELECLNLTGGEVELLAIFLRRETVYWRVAMADLFGDSAGERTRGTYYTRLCLLKAKLAAGGYELATTKAGGAWIAPADRDRLLSMVATQSLQVAA